MSSDFYITSQAKLDEIVDLIKQAKLASFDTEFTRQTTYYPILSIIQIAVKDIAGKQRCFIVDCLCNLDLSGIFAVISDPEIKKIFHSSTQDLQIFYHQSGLVPASIIDTQVMANFCGFGFNVGYSVLVEKICNRKLDKHQQCSDWQRRPLSQKQIEYALLDVTFLEEIYQKFSQILFDRRRVSWYYEEMQNFIKKILTKSPDGLLKKFFLKDKSAKQISQIKKLISWREEWAQKIDIPRQHFLQDEVIERIISDGKVSKSLMTKMDKGLVLEIDLILQQEEEKPLKHGLFAMTEWQKKSFREAKKILLAVSLRENFSPQFLLTTCDLRKIIHENNLFDQIIFGWRGQLFGSTIKSLILSDENHCC